MWPTLFSIGILSVSTAVVVRLIGLFFSGFTFWRRGKDEHYSELQLFDGFLLSLLVGVIGARLGFVLLHFSQFGWNVFSWLSVVSQPGTLDLVFLVTSTLFLFRFAVKKKWDSFEILDFWSLSLTVWLIFTTFADFLSGAGRGKFTDWAVGVVFPGSIEKTHPVQLYALALYFLLYAYLAWAESRYRVFEWYRMGRKSAQTGFLISMFVIFFSLISMLLLLFRLPQFMVWGVALDFWLYFAGVILGVQMLLRRSDKPLLPTAFKERMGGAKENEPLVPLEENQPTEKVQSAQENPPT